jgi:hypothetical protein
MGVVKKYKNFPTKLNAIIKKSCINTKKQVMYENLQFNPNDILVSVIIAEVLDFSLLITVHLLIQRVIHILQLLVVA